MPQFDEWTAYVRFVLTLAAGLTAFCVLVSGLIDQFFTEHSWRDYKRAAKSQRLGGPEAAMDVEDVSILELANQLAGGSRDADEVLARRLTTKSYRSYSGA